MNILIITNMCATEENPTQGAFVKRQYAEINQLRHDDSVDYYEMPEQARKATSFKKRYSLFLMDFIKRFVFSKKRIDIIHVHFFFPTILLAIFYKLFRSPRVKIIATFHGNDVYYYHPPKWWYRLCSKFLNHAIFVSESLKNRFFNSNVPSNVLCAGILPVFHPSQSDKEFDFIFVGTLDDNKGALRLFELCQKLLDTHAFLVVGSGPHAHLFSSLNHPNLTYLSFSEPTQLAQLYGKAKWLLNLSYNESFGLVLSEAMACGTPVIATKTDGSQAQIQHSVNGYFLNVEDIAQQLLSLTGNIPNDKYEKLSIAALSSTENARLSFVAKSILQIYNRFKP